MKKLIALMIVLFPVFVISVIAANSETIVVGHTGGNVKQKNVDTALMKAGLTKEGTTHFTVTFAFGATSIDCDAFYGCNALTDVVIDEGINQIDAYAFFDCPSLKSITIPASVDFIDPYAFYGCPSLAVVSVASGNPHFMSENNVIFNKNKTELIRYPQGKSGLYNIPDGVRTMATSAFTDCHLLTEVVFPDSMQRISRRAFQNCTALTKVDIPEGVPSITQYAFAGCSSLSYVSIPPSINRIDNYAFWQCTSLTNVIIPNSVSMIGNLAFADCSALSGLVVPRSVINISETALDSCSLLVIYGYTDSDIYTYASANRIPFTVIDSTNPDDLPLLISSNTNTGFLNPADKTIFLPDSFTIAAYSVNGGLKWKKWPNNADKAHKLIDKLLEKDIIFYLSDQLNENGIPKTKDIEQSKIITFPYIEAQSKNEKIITWYEYIWEWFCLLFTSTHK